MKNVGIVMTHLGLSQKLFYAADCIKKLQKEYDWCVFTQERSGVAIQPLCSRLDELRIWSYSGTVIATDLLSAGRLIRSPIPKRKLFYVWDLQWLYLQNSYEFFANIYNDPSLELIARSESHAKLIGTCWKPVTGIVEDFNHDQIRKVLQ